MIRSGVLNVSPSSEKNVEYFPLPSLSTDIELPGRGAVGVTEYRFIPGDVVARAREDVVLVTPSFFIHFTSDLILHFCKILTFSLQKCGEEPQETASLKGFGAPLCNLITGSFNK